MWKSRPGGKRQGVVVESKRSCGEMVSPPHTEEQPGGDYYISLCTPPHAQERQQFVHWPFPTCDLYNWKLQNPKSSEKPAKLIDR